MLLYLKSFFKHAINKIKEIEKIFVLAEKNFNSKNLYEVLKNFEKISTELSVLADKSHEIYLFINKVLTDNIDGNNDSNSNNNLIELKDGLQITIDPNCIEIIIPEAIPVMPELITSENKYILHIKRHWKEYIKKAILAAKEKGPLPYFENALVSIEIMNNNNRAWDIDNTAIFFVISTVLNVLKGICIKDDNYKCVRLSIGGSYSSVPNTRIFVRKSDEVNYFEEIKK